jgi:polysaccharide biosynthesis protein PslH
MDVIYFNLLKVQAQQHNVTMITLRRTGDEDSLLDNLGRYCKDIYIVGSPNKKSVLHKICYWAKYSIASLILWRPRCTFYDTPRALTELVARLTSTQGFDVVEVHHSPCSRVVDYVKYGAKVLYMYDVHFRSHRRLAATKRGLGKLLADLEGSKFKFFETKKLRKFDAVLFGQHDDKEDVEALADCPRLVRLMPNCVDTDAYSPGHGKVQENVAIFVGAMMHRANVDAVMNFRQSMWIKIRERVGNAELWIVGASPPQEIQALDGTHGIKVFSNVSDVRPYVAAACVYVAPLRIGSGVKVKIIEALAMGKAIVATPVAAEGMGLVNDHELKVAERGDEFVDAVVELFEDERKRTELGESARDAAERLFSFASGNLELEEIYRRLFQVI